jgi:hypothetical protein
MTRATHAFGPRCIARGRALDSRRNAVRTPSAPSHPPTHCTRTDDVHVLLDLPALRRARLRPAVAVAQRAAHERAQRAHALLVRLALALGVGV